MTGNVDQKPTSQEMKSIINLQSDQDAPVDRKRRAIVRKIAVGSAALTWCSFLPEKWTTPLVEFGSLPAHATTSGAVAAIIQQVKDEIIGPEENVSSVNPNGNTPEEVTADSPYNKTAKIDRSGDIYIDGVLRAKFISSKLGPEYGKSIKIVFNTGEELFVPDTTKDVNQGEMGYRPGGNYTYHKDVDKMEVYSTPASRNRAKYITIHYKG